MLNWARGGIGGDLRSLFDGTLGALVEIYLRDPDSSFQALRYHTKHHYESKGNYIHYSLDTIEGVKYITVISKGEKQMTVEQKKQKILAAIASRGWFTAECYWNEARALEAEGLIRLGDRFFTGGNRKPVWVAA